VAGVCTYNHETEGGEKPPLTKIWTPLPAEVTDIPLLRTPSEQALVTLAWVAFPGDAIEGLMVWVALGALGSLLAGCFAYYPFDTWAPTGELVVAVTHYGIGFLALTFLLSTLVFWLSRLVLWVTGLRVLLTQDSSYTVSPSHVVTGFLCRLGWLYFRDRHSDSGGSRKLVIYGPGERVEVQYTPPNHLDMTGVTAMDRKVAERYFPVLGIAQLSWEEYMASAQVHPKLGEILGYLKYCKAVVPGWELQVETAIETGVLAL